MPFYPTYEEWKPDDPTLKNKITNTFYPTYEEWKLCSSTEFSLFSMDAFYPTYEEWKLFLVIIYLEWILLFLSYL